MEINESTKIEFLGEPDENEYAAQRFEVLNHCVSALLVNALSAIEFEALGVRFIFKPSDIIEAALNKLLLNEPDNIVPASALFLVYIQENDLNVRIYGEQDITLVSINKDQDIDFDDPSPILECVTVSGTETDFESNVVYDTLNGALQANDDAAVNVIIDEVRTLYDDEEDNATESRSHKNKKKAKNKRKMVKASKRKNRAKK